MEVGEKYTLIIEEFPRLSGHSVIIHKMEPDYIFVKYLTGPLCGLVVTCFDSELSKQGAIKARSIKQEGNPELVKNFGYKVKKVGEE